MRETLLIALNTLKIVMKRKSTIWLTFILPTILTVFMIMMNTGEGRDISIGITNKDKGDISYKLINYIENRDKFKIINVEEKNIDSFVAKEKVQCVIVIPEDFTKDVYRNNIKNLKMVSIKSSEVTKLLESYLNIYMDSLKIIAKASNGDKKIFNKIYDNSEKGTLELNIEKVNDKSVGKELVKVSLGFLLMFILSSSSNISKFIIEERKNKTYNRIGATPVGAKQYILGNVLTNFMLTLIQIVIVMIILNKYVLLQNNINTNSLMMFLVLTTFSIVSIVLSIFIVAISKSTTEASNLNIVVTVLTTMIGGCFWDIKMMPKPMQNLSNFTPQKWAMEAIANISTGATFGNIKMEILILILFAVTFFIITVYKIKMDNKTEEFI